MQKHKEYQKSYQKTYSEGLHALSQVYRWIRVNQLSIGVIILTSYKTKNRQYTLRKVSKYWVFSCPYFPIFGLNTEIYGLILRIQPQ